MIIAVDGPAAAGKGTIARALAQHYGFHFLDTGTLYRRVALALLKAHHDPRNVIAATAIAHNLGAAQFADEDLRSEAVAGAASTVAAIAEVRSALLEFQREFASRPPGAVLDGRDIGTVVCPKAEAKLFITASPEVRAERRLQELADRGVRTTLDLVMLDIRQRDDRDRSRTIAPLLPAADAHVIDTTRLSVDDAVSKSIQIVDQILAT